VFTEREAAPLADGAPGGRRYALAEVIDLTADGERERLAAELDSLSGRPG
jgi:hypothetical protein